MQVIEQIHTVFFSYHCQNQFFTEQGKDFLRTNF